MATTQQTMRTDEAGRLAVLQQLAILDTAPEEPFEHVVSLVRSVLGVPIAAVSLIDADRQWFKSLAGLDATETPRSMSFCSHAIEESKPFLIEDALEDARFAANPLVTGDPRIRSYAGIPLRTPEGYHVGALCAIDRQPRSFSEAEVAMLTNLARIVEKELELRRIAERDGLTGSLTRRAFSDRATGEIDRFHRHGRPCSVVIMDIDHFKSVNDTYGHEAGDRVLRDIAKLVSSMNRKGDVLGRLGGEEFAILLPETSASEACIAMERVRSAIEAHDVELADGQTIGVTASFGIAEMNAAITSVDRWLSTADASLYAAKRTGRNRCETAS